MLGRRPGSTLFPYTTLFRSGPRAAAGVPHRPRRLLLGEEGILRDDDPGDRADAVRLEERSEEHTSELQSHSDLVSRLLLEKKNNERDTRRIADCRAPG